MLKIRYNLQDSVLSGWEDDPNKHDDLQPRVGEAVVFLDIVKPIPSDDYEFWYFDGVGLYRSAKPEHNPVPKFTPLNPIMSMPERVLHIETFLKGVFNCD